MHERRARKLLRMLEAARCRRTSWPQMWGNVAVTQAYLTISEVLGHLDLLIADGLVREHDGDDGSGHADVARGRPVRYRSCSRIITARVFDVARR